MDEGARGISTSDHLATWDPPPAASHAWEDIRSIAGAWPAVSRWLRPAGRQAASGLRLIPLLRCAAVARALREASIGPRPDDLDDAVATWIAAMLPHGALSPEMLQRVAASALRDAAGRGLSYPGRGAISVGAAPEVTSLHARPSRALSFHGALTLELEAAHPCASSSGECGAASRTYLVASGLQPSPDGEGWALGFREVMLAPPAFEALQGTPTGRWQRALDEQGAAEVAEQARAFGLPDGEKPWRRLISSFTGRGSREHWLAPSIEEALTTSARSAFAEVPDGRAIAETLARAVGMMERRLCRLHASPRPVISLDLALDPTPPGVARDDARGGSRPLAVACFGDNLDVLRSLGPGLRGRVDGVYIDPPYDTGGQLFRYRDSYGAGPWLSMMGARLDALRDLLHPAAALHVSINEARLAELRLEGDRIFGDGHGLGTTVVRVRHDDRILKGHRALHDVTDYLVGYRRSEAHAPGLRPARDDAADYAWVLECDGVPTEARELGGHLVERFEPDAFRLVKDASGGEGALKRINIRGALREANSSGRFFVRHLEWAMKGAPGCIFRVHGMGGDGLGYRDFIIPPEGSRRRNPDYLQGRPVGRSARRSGRPFSNLVDFSGAFNGVHREGDVEFRNGKKPVAFLEHVLRLQGIDRRQDATVVDCFAGSGSTAVAVSSLDAEDQGARCTVLVERGPWFEDVLIPRLTRAARSVTSGRGVRQLRLARFEDVLDQFSVPSAENLEGDEGEEGGEGGEGDVSARAPRAEVSPRRAEIGDAADANEEMTVRTVSGLALERVRVCVVGTLALARGLDLTLRSDALAMERDAAGRIVSIAWRVGASRADTVDQDTPSPSR